MRSSCRKSIDGRSAGRRAGRVNSRRDATLLRQAPRVAGHASRPQPPACRFRRPSSAARLIHMPAATGSGLRATSRTNRRRSVLNLSRPAHSSRRSAGVAIPRACFTPLGRGSGGEPERVAEWLAALVHHFYLDGPVEPPRTTLGRSAAETAPGLCRCCGQPFDFRHKRAALLLLLGTHFPPPGPRRRRRRSPLPALRNARRRQRRALRW